MYGTNRGMLGNQIKEKLVFTEVLSESFVEKMGLEMDKKVWNQRVTTGK